MLADLRNVFFNRPVQITFISSIILSVIAIAGVLLIGRDGALYLDIARQVQSSGVEVAFKRFSWPFFPIILAYTQELLPFLSLEKVAYLYSIAYSAGISALVVFVVKKHDESAVSWAFLLVFAITAFNSFRYDIIRDTGAWFFQLASLVLVINYNHNKGWVRGALSQLCIVLAASYRLESLFVFPVIMLYLLLNAKPQKISQRFLNLLKFSYLFILGFILLTAFALTNDLLSQQRVGAFLNIINPDAVYKAYMLKADKFAKIALAKWAYDDAPLIIAAGIAVSLVWSLVKYAGIAAVLLLPSNARTQFKAAACSPYLLFTIAAAFYFFVLYVFFLQKGFTNSRYATPLILLLVPLFATAAQAYFTDKKRLSYVFAGLLAVSALSNVVSTGEKKTHYLAAAVWLSENTQDEDVIYYEDGRIAYYAGKPYPRLWQQDILTGNAKYLRRFDYYVVEYKVADTKRIEAAQEKYKEVFSAQTKKKKVFVFKRQL